MHPLWLILIGIAVGMIGTLIGVGGGFLITPLLLFLHPADPPRTITAVSLFVVLCNATSGALAYARRKLIDFKVGAAFVSAALPGAVLGAFLTRYISRPAFEPIMGVVLAAGAVYLLWRTRHPAPKGTIDAAPTLTPGKLWLGIAISGGVGLIASLLGIGGGIIHVPLMIYTLGYPPHRATATSQFVLAFTSAAAVALHLADGQFHDRLDVAIPLGIGAVIGAQIGAALAKKVSSRGIVIALACVTLAVSARLMWGAFRP